MPKQLLSLLHALVNDSTAEQVHFHSGPGGRPAVCEDPRCDRPQLSVD